MSLEAGFNRYRLVERVALGAFGALWRAADRVPGKEVAIRIVSPPKVTEEAIAAFEAEMTNAMALRHSSLARVYEVGRSTDGGAWAASEFVVGDSLESVVATEGPLPPAAALRLFSEVASALDELHRRALVHGSLSARTVLLQRSKSGSMRAKVIALGRAHLAPAQTKNSPPPEGSYSSPEVVASRQYGAASDIWALGVLLFHCVTGKPPFAARTPSSYLAETRNVGRVLDAVEDEIVRGLIEQCMALAPDGRATTAALIKQAEFAGWIEQGDVDDARAPEVAPALEATTAPIEPAPQPALVVEEPRAIAQPEPIAEPEPIAKPEPIADVPDDALADFRPPRRRIKAIVGAIAASAALLTLFVATREPQHRPAAPAAVVAEKTPSPETPPEPPAAATATATATATVAAAPTVSATAAPALPTLATAKPPPAVAANAQPAPKKAADDENPYE